jgi:hypothetical protein
MALAIGLIFCFIFLALGMKNSMFRVFGGIVWISVALTVFISYGQLYLLIGLGLGFVLMIEGAVSYGH